MNGNSVSDWQELSALYEQADSLTDVERETLLSRLEGQRHRLFPQLLRMLNARTCVLGSNFLEDAPSLSAALVREAPGWERGSSVGAYRLLRHVGSGGMADVWLAERADGTFERRVAIKLLFEQPTRLQRESFTTRFNRERDILASLAHSNIAGLHDAGITAIGQPWLAIEFVQGDSIVAWCDQRRLTIRDRVVLFQQILLAVQFAHANLIIHRDLKPSNVFVTERGEVKLLDFGIAKLLESEGAQAADTVLTRDHGRPLTPRYASPEQIQGHALTTSSDIYSLGVILYELLSGQSPYEHDESIPLERKILEGDVRVPSRRVTDEAAAQHDGTRHSVARLLRGDLDAIVLRSLSKRPEGRYFSVEAFRADLDRWLSGRPVTAKTPSIQYRIWKFYLRHKTSTILAAASVVALVATTSAATIQGMQARREARRALATSSFMREMFKITDPENSGGKRVTANEILTNGRARAISMFGDQPLLEADVLSNIGRMQFYGGDYKAADSTYQLVTDIYRQHGLKADVVRAQLDLAENAQQLGDVKRATQLLADLDDSTEITRDKTLRAKFFTVRGLVFRMSGDLQDSRRDLAEALKLETSIHGSSDSAVIDLERNLANVYNLLGMNNEALLHMHAAVEKAKNNAQMGAREFLAIDVETILAGIFAGQYLGVVEQAKDLQVRCDTLLGPEEEHCILLINLRAVVLLRIGDVPRQAELLARLLHSADNDASPRRQAESLALAVRILSSDRALRTNPERRQALIRFAVSAGSSTEARTMALVALADSDIKQSDPVQAEAWARQALMLQRASAHPLPQSIARSELMVGIAEEAQGRHADALASIQDAGTTLARVLGEQDTMVVLFNCDQIRSLTNLNRLTEAQQIADKARTILAQRFGEGSLVVQRITRIRPESVPGRPSVARAGPYDYFT